MNLSWLTIFWILGVIAVVSSGGCTTQSKPSTPPPAGHGEHSHGAAEKGDSAAQLVLSTLPQHPQAGEAVTLTIVLHAPTGQMLTEFEPTHEKLAHLIIVREGLDEFAHLHPTLDSQGNFKAKHNFAKGGKFFVFLDYKAAGSPPATARSQLLVEGDAAKSADLVTNVPGIVRGNGLQADVTMPSTGDQSQIVTFELQDEEGQRVHDLEPYLGAMGHLVVLSADAGTYVHAHPLTERNSDGIVKFEVHFPGPGTYKGWGQFQRDGKVFTIPAFMSVSTGTSHQ